MCCRISALFSTRTSQESVILTLPMSENKIENIHSFPSSIWCLFNAVLSSVIIRCAYPLFLRCDAQNTLPMPWQILSCSSPFCQIRVFLRYVSQLARGNRVPDEGSRGLPSRAVSIKIQYEMPPSLVSACCDSVFSRRRYAGNERAPRHSAPFKLNCMSFSSSVGCTSRSVGESPLGRSAIEPMIGFAVLRCSSWHRGPYNCPETSSFVLVVVGRRESTITVVVNAVHNTTRRRKA